MVQRRRKVVDRTGAHERHCGGKVAVVAQHHDALGFEPTGTTAAELAAIAAADAERWRPLIRDVGFIAD